MIFVTVGTQLPFDRLLGAMDAWAAAQPATPVRAQTGQSTVALPHLDAARFLPKPEMDAAFEAAQVIVGHAGMGTILTGAALGKPVIVMPRKAALGEHRNDHQAATAARLAHLPMLHVVEDAAALAAALDRCLDRGTAAPRLSGSASPALLAAVSSFVRTGQFGEAA